MASARVARSGRVAALLACLLLAAAALAPHSAAAGGPPDDVRAPAPSGPPDDVRALLDGEVIPLAEVGGLFCHDFAFPEIQCFSSAGALEASLAEPELEALTAGVTYVTIYDYTSFQGSYMHLSEDYWALSLIGWNDRISSFVVRNYQSGAFWTDWLYSGTKYNFCCNTQMSYIPGYDNSFSSVYRN